MPILELPNHGAPTLARLVHLQDQGAGEDLRVGIFHLRAKDLPAHRSVIFFLIVVDHTSNFLFDQAKVIHDDHERPFCICVSVCIWLLLTSYRLQYTRKTG